MPGATLRHPKESFESLMRRYKKAVEKAETLRDLRDHEAFEKPSSIRKRKKAAARKRHLRQMEEQKVALDPRARLRRVKAPKPKKTHSWITGDPSPYEI